MPCFGFAVTLLIVSLEVPRTSGELLATMRGFGAFVVTFLMLAGLWYSQFTFFRRYGLEDRVTVIAESRAAVHGAVLRLSAEVPLQRDAHRSADEADHRHAHGIELVVLPEHKPLIFAIFGAGFAGVMIVFTLLYRHAWKKREELGLNEFEIFETEHSVRRLTVATGGRLHLLPDRRPGRASASHERREADRLRRRSPSSCCSAS